MLQSSITHKGVRRRSLLARNKLLVFSVYLSLPDQTGGLARSPWHEPHAPQIGGIVTLPCLPDTGWTVVTVVAWKPSKPGRIALRHRSGPLPDAGFYVDGRAA